MNNIEFGYFKKEYDGFSQFDNPIFKSPNKNIAVVGLDIGWNLGVGAILPEGCWAFGGLISNKREKRHLILAESIAHVVRMFQPSLLVVEGYAFGAKFKREDMGEVGGVIRYVLQRMNTLYAVVPPRSWQSFYATKGEKFTKERSIELAKQYLPELKKEHLADALLMARYGVMKYADLVTAG